MATVGDSQKGATIRQIEGAPPQGDVVFMSTDSVGTPGDLNLFVLDRLGLGSDLLPKGPGLSGGYAFRRAGRHVLCFVVTVGSQDSATLLETNLLTALLDPAIGDARTLWLPLMGTGAGGLTETVSLEIVMQCLRDSGWTKKGGVEITVSSPPTDSSTASADVYRLKRTPAVDELLQVAGRLRRVRRDGGSQLSTTLLFFALAESGTTEITPALAGDAAAKGFRVALQRLAGDRYEEVLKSRFESEELENILLSPNLLPPTNNVCAVLSNAHGSGNGDGVDVHGLITNLLGLPKASYLKVLNDLNISAERLLSAYSDERSQFIHSVLLSDVAGASDSLGYARYAAAIAKFLTHEKTPPPLSISVQAPWGVGKSSLMQQIRQELDPNGASFADGARLGLGSVPLKLKDVLRFLNRGKAEAEPAKDVEAGQAKLWTVWFNAWKYETSEQVWAGLVGAIVDQISARLPLAERELFLLRLQLARIDDGIVRKKIYDRVANAWWSTVRRWIIYAAGAAASLLGFAAAAQTFPNLPNWSFYGFFGASALPLILAVSVSLAYVWQRQKTRNEPASFSLSEYIQVPPYNEAVGSIHRIHQDLLRVLALTPRIPGRPARSGTGSEDRNLLESRTPIVIFIDDLDRCSPSKIASVVEGVSMFLASDLYRCMFVIGMDPQLIAAALESKHCDVIEKLPSYERAVPLGWRFMDKFIQLPFTIPPSDATTLDRFVQGFGESAADDTAEPSEASSDRPQPIAPAPQNGSKLANLGPQLLPSLQGIVRAVWRELSPSSPSSRDESGMDAEVAPTQADASEQLHAPSTSLAAAAQRDVESRDVGELVTEVRRSAATNPRELKRMANLGRLYLQLRNVRREQEKRPGWASPTLQQYARWIVLASRWPDAMRWLLWGTDEATWPQAGTDMPLTVRRLRTLEDAAALAGTAQDWQTIIHSTLRVPTGEQSDWANDAKLFDFFHAEAGRPDFERISAAAEKEFW